MRIDILGKYVIIKVILYHNKRHQVTAIRQYASKLRPGHIICGRGVFVFLEV